MYEYPSPYPKCNSVPGVACTTAESKLGVPGSRWCWVAWFAPAKHLRIAQKQSEWVIPEAEDMLYCWVEFNGLVSLQLINGNDCRVAGHTRAVRHTTPRDTRSVKQCFYNSDRKRTFSKEGYVLDVCLKSTAGANYFVSFWILFRRLADQSACWTTVSDLWAV